MKGATGGKGRKRKRRERGEKKSSGRVEKAKTERMCKRWRKGKRIGRQEVGKAGKIKLKVETFSERHNTTKEDTSLITTSYAYPPTFMMVGDVPGAGTPK